jgi:Na+-driven multidrug efflux pump
MPDPLNSLAVWPVLFGFLIMWQSVGIGYNEAVIALLDEPRSLVRLRRFTILLTTVMTLLLLAVTATPLSAFWFGRVAALPPALVELARQALWLGLLLPGLRIWQSWYQGALTYARRTRSITESMVVLLLITGTILGVGIYSGKFAGVYVGQVAFASGMAAQVLWLAWRSRPVMQKLAEREDN